MSLYPVFILTFEPLVNLMVLELFIAQYFDLFEFTQKNTLILDDK